MWLISNCKGCKISLNISSKLLHQQFSHVEQTLRLYLLCNKKSTYSNIWRRVPPDRGMCQNPSNNSIQSRSWTMIPLSWFPNFHILWVWTQEADLSYPWSRDSVCVPWTQFEWIAFCTWHHVKGTKIFLIPRLAVHQLIMILPWGITFHVEFLNDFQFLSRAELTQKATKMFRCCYFHWNIIYLPHERI